MLHIYPGVNFFPRYADRAKQILCKAVVNEDPNAKVNVKGAVSVK